MCSSDLYGAGDYPVVVSLYGNNLQNDAISIKPSSGCSIQKIYSYSDYGLSEDYWVWNLSQEDWASCNCTIPVPEYILSSNVTQMTIVVAPSNSWDVVDLIQLKAVGNATVSYALAIVGDSWAKVEEEW